MSFRYVPKIGTFSYVSGLVSIDKCQVLSGYNCSLAALHFHIAYIIMTLIYGQRNVVSIAVCLCVWLLPTEGLSQELILDACTTAGTSMEGERGSLYWTVGEPFVSKFETSAGDLYQGFQQDIRLIIGDDNEDEEPFVPTLDIVAEELIYYPNPLRTRLLIEDFKRKVSTIMVYNTAGDLLFTNRRTNDKQILWIDMAHVPDGVYFFRLFGKKDKLLRQFRVVKQE